MSLSPLVSLEEVKVSPLVALRAVNAALLDPFARWLEDVEQLYHPSWLSLREAAAHMTARHTSLDGSLSHLSRPKPAVPALALAD